MIPVYAWGSAVLAFTLALVLTAQFLRYAVARGILDVPNARSSHELPTPRGGGVAIVIAAVAAFVLLALLHVITWRTAGGLITAGIVAAAIGYVDDRYQVSLAWRLAAQFASAACVLGFIGSAPVVAALGLPPAVSVVAAVLALFYLVWMLNLTNFMDGIDGIASVETIAICAGTAICANMNANAAAVATSRVELTSVCVVLAAATAGFLRWNWPPARIFMGDAGSGFLGVLLGALSLIAGNAQPSLLWSCIILGGVFVVDATVTLFWRIASRQKFYHAHRSHAYQHAAQRWGHQRVTVSVCAINACWLLPWAVLTANGTLHGAVALSLAYIPLVATAIRLRAGVPQ